VSVLYLYLNLVFLKEQNGDDVDVSNVGSERVNMALLKVKEVKDFESVGNKRVLVLLEVKELILIMLEIKGSMLALIM
jgi:hypothetical protein